MTWGEQNTQEEGFQQMDYAVEKEINFFDTAELYAIPPKEKTYGRTEEIKDEEWPTPRCEDHIFGSEAYSFDFGEIIIGDKTTARYQEIQSCYPLAVSSAINGRRKSKFKSIFQL